MNNTQIPIDELYDQLTLILQEEKYAKARYNCIRNM